MQLASIRFIMLLLFDKLFLYKYFGIFCKMGYFSHLKHFQTENYYMPIKLSNFPTMQQPPSPSPNPKTRKKKISIHPANWRCQFFWCTSLNVSLKFYKSMKENGCAAFLCIPLCVCTTRMPADSLVEGTSCQINLVSDFNYWTIVHLMWINSQLN